MPLYDITEDAEEDLREIVRYTFHKWGVQQVKRYRSSLSKTFDDIGRGHIIKRSYSDKIPEARVVKSDCHYVFYLQHSGKKPIIFAVIHEARDIVALLTSRLNSKT